MSFLEWVYSQKAMCCSPSPTSTPSFSSLTRPAGKSELLPELRSMLFDTEYACAHVSLGLASDCDCYRQACKKSPSPCTTLLMQRESGCSTTDQVTWLNSRSGQLPNCVALCSQGCSVATHAVPTKQHQSLSDFIAAGSLNAAKCGLRRQTTFRWWASSWGSCWWGSWVTGWGDAGV